MRSAINLTSAERLELERRASGRTNRTEDARRARLILLLADCHTWNAASVRIRCSRGFIAKWSRRFAEQRLAGLYGRHAGQAATVLTPELELRILEATRRPPHHSAHWTTRKLAAQLGISHMMVARVWRTHGIKPHVGQRYGESKVANLREQPTVIVGLYLNRTAHAAVFIVSGEESVQSIERRDKVPPFSLDRAEPRDLGRVRHSLFALHAALTTKAGAKPGRTTNRHSSAELAAFLTDIVITRAREQEIRVIANLPSGHKNMCFEELLAQNPKLKILIAPTCSSWLTQVELSFGSMEQDSLNRAAITSDSSVTRKLMRHIRLCNKRLQLVKWILAPPIDN